jgi:hypothetical protein
MPERNSWHSDPRLFPSAGKPSSARGRFRSINFALGALLALAALQAGWNVVSLPPLIENDGPPHAGYVLTIIEEQRLPRPLEGWSTFHPPLYYLVGAGAWSALEPLGPRAVMAGLRAVSVASWLFLGLAAFLIARRLAVPPRIAWLGAALALFVPASQMTGVAMGNEALGAALAAGALFPLIRLQSDPRDPRAGLVWGLLTGLALATKYSALMLLCACPLPFLRRDLGRRGLLAGAALLLGVLLVAGPVYVRNYRLTGLLMPMTRSLEPVRRLEATWTIRERRLSDYWRVDPSVLWHPTLFLPDPRARSGGGWNPSMQSVPSLAYASLWGDPLQARLRWPAATLSGRVLSILGLVPTLLVLWGFVQAVVGMVRSSGRAPDGPLVVMGLAGITAFCAFTWRAPALVAVKGSYLAPLIVPAAVFFGRSAALLKGLARTLAVLVSSAAICASLLFFTDGLILKAKPMHPNVISFWHRVDAELPRAHIGAAMNRLIEP